MKRFICLSLSLCLLLCGCGVFSERIREPVRFYYVRTDYQSNMDSIIVSEQREAYGHRDDLSYLLALYLMGPTDEALHSPVPPGTRIFTAEQTLAGVYLEMTDTAATLTDSEFTIVCTCLTLTCLDITDAERVSIRSGNRSVTMTRDNVILFDSGIAATEETE